MTESKNQEIERIKFEDILSLVFIVTSILNIYGDKLHIEYIATNSREKELMARDIYKLVLIITILIYLYFLNRNYSFLKTAYENRQNTKLPFIRLMGSVFLIVGVILLLYVLVESDTIPDGVEI